jgi:ATP-binding cassette, subfamily C (CFTR/MRP), member 1
MTQIVYFCLTICQAVFLALHQSSSSLRTRASIAADTLSLAAAIAAGLLSWFHHRFSVRPSTLLAVFLCVLTLVGIARLRTLWLIPHARGAAVTFSLIFGLTISALLLESQGKIRSLRSPGKYEGSGPEPFSGFWKRVGFIWLVSTLRLGYQKILSVDDLPPLDYRLASDELYHTLEKTWSRCKSESLPKPYLDLLTGRR